MPYLPRHQSHRKKKSLAPYILGFLVIVLAGIGFTQEKQIRLFFSKDQRQKLEKQKLKIQNAIEKSELTDVFVRDFHSYSADLLDKEPLNGSALHYRARAFYYELLLTGVRFDSSSLVANIQSPLSDLMGNSNKAGNDTNEMYTLARQSTAIQDSIPETPANQFLLFLGESVRGRKVPPVLYQEYSHINLTELDPEFRHPYVWLLFYTSVRTGKQKELESLLEKNRADDFTGKLLLTEREEEFLKGVCHYHAKDYVPALNSIRKVKTDFPDSITRSATLLEARMFYVQNLGQKAVDLLLQAYESGGKKHPEYLDQVKKWVGSRPDLKANLPKEGVESDD